MPSDTSRSMMPVTLPFDTMRKRDSSVMVMPARLRSSAAMTSNFGSVIAERHAQPLAQLHLDGARGAQQPQPQPQLLLGRGLRLGPGPALHRHISPPETEMAWPLIAWAAGVHSHSTVSATSSGVMKPTLRIEAREVAARLCARAAGLVGDVGERGFEQRRLREAGAHRIDRDPTWRQLRRQRPGKPDDAMLGRAVGGDIGVALEPGGGGDEDDAPPGCIAPLCESGSAALTRQERAGQVDVEHALPVGEVDLARSARFPRRRHWR